MSQFEIRRRWQAWRRWRQALIFGGMSWSKPKPEKPLREQLMDAREALINQIAILDIGPLKGEPGEGAYFASQAAELRIMLGEIESQLADAEPSSA